MRLAGRAGRFAFGLTPRTIWLLAAGLLLALPGFFRRAPRLRHAGRGMRWCCLRSFLDGLRLPAAAADHRRALVEQRTGARQRDRDSSLSVEHSAGTILDCRLIDDLPDALVADACHATACAYFRACQRRCATNSSRASAAMCKPERCYLRYCFAARTGGALGRWRRSSKRCACIRRCGRAKTRRFFWRAAGRSTCNFARRASAAWAATSRACANISRATTCATCAGRRRRGAAS